jgi:hypothetical protein
VCETSPDVILEGKFGHLSQANPRAIWESICCFSVRYPAPFIFAGDRTTAQRMTQSLLTKFAREHVRAVEEMTRAANRLRKAG